MHRLNVWLAVILVSSLSGCRWLDDAVVAATGDAIKGQVEQSNRDFSQKLDASLALVKQQEKAIAELRHDLAETKKELGRLDFVQKVASESYKNEWASLSSDGGGYGIARTNLGPAIIRVEGISPYLDGFKLKLWVSVLVPAEINGLKGTVSWFEQDPEVLKKNKDEFRSKEFASLDTFSAGRYGEIEVALTPASASGLKTFSVSLQTNQISINRPYGANSPGR